MATDPLHDGDDTEAAWTTLNAAEAMPGVATPLGWTAWFPACERGLRGAFADIGAIPTAEVRVPARLDERFVAMFHGHFAGNIDMMRRMGDQMPGSSGEAVEEQYFASARPDIPSARDVRRIPIVLTKLPVSAWRSRRRVLQLAEEVERWWQRSVAPGSTATMAEATEVFRDATRRLEDAIRAHTVVSMIGQGMFEQVRRQCESAGLPALVLRLVSADRDVHEAAMVGDLWDVAHGRLDIAAFLMRHGFHGPAEGQLASRSWREDPAPLEALLSSYRGRQTVDDDRAARDADRAGAASELFATLGPIGRARARATLSLARTYIPLREVGRATFLKAFDVIRCMSRRIGAELVGRGIVDDIEDVFFLTADEVLGALPADPRREIMFRKDRRDAHLGVELADSWVGPAVPMEPPSVSNGSGDVELHAIGASPGVVEGRVVVVENPAAPGDLDEGDVLVCRTTDPSWAPLFFLVSACVIDVGGAMSHGAIVARELGIPCVINTRDGTARLRTGDHVCVDGSAGTVRVLAPVA